MFYQIMRRTAQASPWIAAGLIIAVWISRSGRGGSSPGLMHILPTIREEVVVADAWDSDSMPVHQRKKQRLS